MTFLDGSSFFGLKNVVYKLSLYSPGKKQTNGQGNNSLHSLVYAKFLPWSEATVA